MNKKKGEPYVELRFNDLWRKRHNCGSPLYTSPLLKQGICQYKLRYKNKILFAQILAILAAFTLAGCLRQNNSNASTLAPGDYAFSLEHGNITRRYALHVPPSYNASKPAPLVIYLHGGGGSQRAAKLDGMNEQSDKHGFILAAPAGTGKLETSLLSWNGGDWDCGTRCGYAHENNVDDVGFISQMISDIESKASVDNKRIYATGISNGALMAMKLACDLDEKIASVAPIALVAIPKNCNPKRPVSTMYVHGTGDLCTPFSGGKGTCLSLQADNIAPAETKAEQLTAKNNCEKQGNAAYQNVSATCTSYSCEAGTEIEFCKVEGMGHAWPSGAQYLPESIIGPVSQDISFDEIWQFFERNPLP